MPCLALAWKLQEQELQVLLCLQREVEAQQGLQELQVPKELRTFRHGLHELPCTAACCSERTYCCQQVKEQG